MLRTGKRHEDSKSAARSTALCYVPRVPSRLYTWVFRAPGKRFIRFWILGRQSTRIRIRAGLDAGAALDPPGAPPLEAAALPLDYALARGDHAMMRRLMDHGARTGGIPESPVKTFRIDGLVAAIDAGDTGRVRQLVDGGVSVRGRGILAPRPLMSAAAKGLTEIVRLLLEAGADPAGAVEVAAGSGDLAVARLLLEAGAPADDRDDEGTIALISAAYAGSLDMVRLLIEHGADVDHRDSDDDAALIEAAYRGHVEIYDYLRPLTRDPEIHAEAEELARRWRGKHRRSR